MPLHRIGRVDVQIDTRLGCQKIKGLIGKPVDDCAQAEKAGPKLAASAASTVRRSTMVRSLGGARTTGVFEGVIINVEDPQFMAHCRLPSGGVHCCANAAVISGCVIIFRNSRRSILPAAERGSSGSTT